MWNNKRSARLSLALTYLFMVLLLAITIFLPALITWYAEVKGRSAHLSTVVMLTCYPCVPLAALALISLRRLLLNILKNEITSAQNVLMLRRISWCCLCAAAIMLFAGIYYMPFYIAGAAAGACGLVVRVVKNLLSAAKINKEDPLSQADLETEEKI